MFAFYIKYCVPDDFTKLYPGIMYFTLCEATDREENIADTYFVELPYFFSKTRVHAARSESLRNRYFQCAPPLCGFTT